MYKGKLEQKKSFIWDKVTNFCVPTDLGLEREFANKKSQKLDF